MNERIETNNPEATEALGRKAGTRGKGGADLLSERRSGRWQNGLYEGLCQGAWDYGACDQPYLCHCE